MSDRAPGESAFPSVGVKGMGGTSLPAQRGRTTPAATSTAASAQHGSDAQAATQHGADPVAQQPVAAPSGPGPVPIGNGGGGGSGSAPKLPPRKQPAATKAASAVASNGGAAASNSSSAACASPPPAMAAGNGAGSTASTSTSGSKDAVGSTPPKPTSKSSFMPSLPPRQAVHSSGPVLDPDEPAATQKLRKEVHAIRVSLIRAAQRLGYDHENGLVKQVLYRLNLAEKLKAPWRRGKRLDPALAASREASRLEQEQGSGVPLGFTVKMMLIGLTGAGKTQLINSLLSPDGVGPAPAATASGSSAAPDASSSGRNALVDPFEGVTKRVQVVEGTVHGIRIVCVDTPGLVASAAATGYNGRVLQQIRSAYRRHKPDLVVYVDRLDASASAGGELPALRALSESLGAGIWLNTIVALSHAGSPPPCGPKGQLSFDTFANQRSHVLQQVIRSASGDNRLMNPTAFVDSHPYCRVNSAGQAIIANGMPWKAHLYLMIVSAKLLADTESMLQMQDGSSGASAAGGSGAGGNAAAMQQMMMMGGAGSAPRQVPLPYLISSLTQFSRPLKYPDHELVMDTRRMERAMTAVPDARQSRNMLRQVKGRLLQLRQAHANKERMARSFRNATLAGGKVTPEPPGLATKRPPSVHPPNSYRYRVPEPANGWIVRPHIESHGMDNSDGIEGLYLEKAAVAGRQLEPSDAPTTSAPAASSSASSTAPGQQQQRRGRRRGADARRAGPSDLDRMLGGVPYHHYASAQCSKEHKAIQVRSEATVYHDPLGGTTSTLSADVQTSGGAQGVPLDALCTLRADVRRRGILGRRGKATVGLAVSRIAEGCRPHRGPAAVGTRLQQTLTTQLFGGASKVSAALACATTLPALGGSADPMMVAEREGCIGGNLEITTDLQPLMGMRQPLPLTLGGNALRYRGDVLMGLAAAMQYQASRSEMVGGRLQLSSKGKAGLSVKLKSQEHWWAGLVAMAFPLGTLLLQTIGVLK